MEDVKRTSDEWYQILYPNKEVIIIDPDGWDRSNWEYSWGEESINEDEFKKRLLNSTCSLFFLKENKQ